MILRHISYFPRTSLSSIEGYQQYSLTNFIMKFVQSFDHPRKQCAVQLRIYCAIKAIPSPSPLLCCCFAYVSRQAREERKSAAPEARPKQIFDL